MFISLLEFIFPPRCGICNSILSQGSPICICEPCASDMNYFNNCINSLNLPEDFDTFCDGMVCVGRYCNSLKNSLKRFKFGNKPSYFRAFGKLLALKVEHTIQIGKIDVIIPVPMHKSRYKQRGYNHAELIAGHAARQLGIRLEKNLLVKNVLTQNQSLLGKSERLVNLEGAFKVLSSKAVVGKSILLVDDIITTGSTLNQCSKALKLAGAARIIAGVIATTRDDY